MDDNFKFAIYISNCWQSYSPYLLTILLSKLTCTYSPVSQLVPSHSTGTPRQLTLVALVGLVAWRPEGLVTLVSLVALDGLVTLVGRLAMVGLGDVLTFLACSLCSPYNTIIYQLYYLAIASSELCELVFLDINIQLKNLHD